MGDPEDMPPNPDPSEATIAFVERITRHRQEILDAELNEVRARIEAHTVLTDEQVAGLRRELEGRVSSMDKAAVVLAEEVNRTPTRMQLLLTQVQELQTLRFHGVDQRFESLAQQTIREKTAADMAVAAALNAQKEMAATTNMANTESIRKADDATAEKIAKLEQLVTGQVTSLNEKVDDEKQALATTRLELTQTIAAFRQEVTTNLSAVRSELVSISTRRLASTEDRVDHRAGANLVLVAAGTFVAIIVAALTLYAAVKP